MTAYQLFLLPARTAEEAARWGSVAMEYAATFPNIHFARDPEGIDWRGYQHVTIVRPAVWPVNLPLIIKQANPAAVIDRIPVDTPEALQLLLNVRVYYGWRYGPQTDFDWKLLWPPGVTLIGLHGRADGEFQEADYPVVYKAQLEAVKITSHATMTTVQRLRAINPAMFILIRPMVSFRTFEELRHITPAQFVEWTISDLHRLYDYDSTLRYIEIHNEPNLRQEGLGGSWADGAEFGDWFLETMRLYRLEFPEAKFGFPGLSPGPALAYVGRMASEEFLEGAAPAAQQADWIGLHAYWTNEREMSDEAVGGLSFVRYRDRFPEKLIFITEFGNPVQPRAEVAAQYVRYYSMLRHVRGLGAIFAYVLSTSEPGESAGWAWRDESGNDLGVAAAVGRREYILDNPGVVFPTPTPTPTLTPTPMPTVVRH